MNRSNAHRKEVSGASQSGVTDACVARSELTSPICSNAFFRLTKCPLASGILAADLDTTRSVGSFLSGMSCSPLARAPCARTPPSQFPATHSMSRISGGLRW